MPVLQSIVNRLSDWWRNIRRPPVVRISRSGQLTPRPQVHVSVAGLSGSQTVYTWDADDQGEACATMYGRGLASIMRRKLVDERPFETFPAPQA